MTTDTIDTIDALLARYVAGTLPVPVRVLVEAHLDLQPRSRDFVRALEAIAGDELVMAKQRPIADRDARLAAIFASDMPQMSRIAVETDPVMPRVLQDFIGHRIADIPWRTKMPGFREFDLGEVDGCQASMFWIKAGRKIPHHTHEGQEFTLVLDGAFTDVNGRYGRGDISVADESVNHRPIAESDRPCIGFAVTDAPLRFNGPLGQRVTDILGF